MSANNATPQSYFAAGVFKLDYKSAGFPDLMRVAKEWAQDPNFYEIIVRTVSDKNFGIQFVYIAKGVEGNPIKAYQDKLVQQFGKGHYAVDYNYMNSSDSNDLYSGIIVMKDFKSEI